MIVEVVEIVVHEILNPSIKYFDGVFNIKRSVIAKQQNTVN